MLSSVPSAENCSAMTKKKPSIALEKSEKTDLGMIVFIYLDSSRIVSKKMSSTNQIDAKKAEEIFEKIVNNDSNDEFAKKFLKEMYIIKK